MECEWTRDVCKELVKLGAVVFKCHVNRYAEPGWPDRWIGHAMWNGWLEFKDETTRLSELQALRIAAINERWPGGAYVARRHPDGVAIEDHERKLLALVEGGARRMEAAGLLLALLELQLKDSAWIEERQALIGRVAEKVAAHAGQVAIFSSPPKLTAYNERPQ